MDEFPERMDYADLDDEDLVESLEQIQALIKTFSATGDTGLAAGLQGSVDRMTKEIAGRKERYEAMDAPEED